MLLIHPSLPPSSGVARWLWSWVKPKIYDHLEWSASKTGEWTDNTKHMSTFVVVLVSNDGDANVNRLSVPEVCSIHLTDPCTTYCLILQSSTELPRYSLNVSRMNSKLDVTVCYFQISCWTSIGYTSRTEMVPQSDC